MNTPSPAIDCPQSANKRLLRALRREPVDRPPFWFMRQAGRYLPEYRAIREKTGSFLELCYNSEAATEVTLQPISRFGADAAILFADILLVPDALGQALSFREGEGPILEPIRTRDQIPKFDPDRFHAHLGPVYDTVGRLHRVLPSDVALIGFAGAPWTVATYMVEGGGSADHATVKRWAFSSPDTFQILIDVLVEATTAYLTEQVRAGAETLQLFDTWAGALPASAVERWCIDPVRRIVQRLRAAGVSVPVIGFPRGVGVNYSDYAHSTGVQGVSMDATVPLEWAREVLQTSVVVQGNLDPQLVVVGGDAMRQGAIEILRVLAGGPFIFNLGHGLVPQTPPEHVAALSELLRSWGS